MKKILISLIILSIFIISACGSTDANADTQVTTESATVENATLNSEQDETKETVETAETTVPSVRSTDEIYNAYLTKLCNKLSNIIVDDTHLDGFSDQEGVLGISEYAISGDVDMLKKMGYLIQDINGDETAELIIFQVDQPDSEPCTGTRILSAYTVADGDMVLIFEGNSRNRYFLLDNGTIYNECAESTARLGFGIYQLSADGTALICEEFNFVDYVDAQTANCYRNQSGQFDIDNSELMDGGIVAYDAEQKEYAMQILTYDLTSFEAYVG